MDVQLFCHFFGQIQSHSGGLFSAVTGTACKAFLKNIGQVTASHPCSVILDTQHIELLFFIRPEAQDGVIPAVFYGIADDLGKEKMQSPPV